MAECAIIPREPRYIEGGDTFYVCNSPLRHSNSPPAHNAIMLCTSTQNFAIFAVNACDPQLALEVRDYQEHLRQPRPYDLSPHRLMKRNMKKMTTRKMTKIARKLLKTKHKHQCRQFLHRQARF